jgi:hypothetical protein
MSQQRPAQPRIRRAAIVTPLAFGLRPGVANAAGLVFRLQLHLRVAVLASSVVAVSVFASSATAFVTACPKVSRATITAATGLPHTAVLPVVQNDDPHDCYLLLWRGHRPSPGKQSKAAEKAGRLAILTVKSEDLHEPYSEAHSNGFPSILIPSQHYIEESYTPFAVSTFGAESALAGTGKYRSSSFQVIGLWWSYRESAYVQIYLGQYHKSGRQLKHELTVIAARTVPVFGL